MGVDTTGKEFLSTPSARRATHKEGLTVKKGEFLSTPSARRATTLDDPAAAGKRISIHALREEGDPRQTAEAIASKPFLSTPSARRATDLKKAECKAMHISIHALREEGD